MKTTIGVATTTTRLAFASILGPFGVHLVKFTENTKTNNSIA